MSAPDLYRKLERAVRQGPRPMLLDAFLPAPETLESAVDPPAPPPPPLSLEESSLSRLDRDEDPPPPPPKAKKKKRASKEEAPKSLQEEIEEFMKRDQGALAPDDEPFAKSPLAPDVDPDPKSG